MNQVSSRAATALALAQKEGAAQYAPYEFTKASEYYRKAREKGGHSYYQTAIDYGHKCEDLAVKARSMAREKAAEAKRQGDVPATPPAEEK